jgi:hypothetical protein
VLSADEYFVQVDLAMEEFIMLWYPDIREGLEDAPKAWAASVIVCMWNLLAVENLSRSDPE